MDLKNIGRWIKRQDWEDDDMFEAAEKEEEEGKKKENCPPPAVGGRCTGGGADASTPARSTDAGCGGGADASTPARSTGTSTPARPTLLVGVKRRSQEDSDLLTPPGKKPKPQCMDVYRYVVSDPEAAAAAAAAGIENDGKRFTSRVFLSREDCVRAIEDRSALESKDSDVTVELKEEKCLAPTPKELVRSVYRYLLGVEYNKEVFRECRGCVYRALSQKHHLSGCLSERTPDEEVRLIRQGSAGITTRKLMEMSRKMSVHYRMSPWSVTVSDCGSVIYDDVLPPREQLLITEFPMEYDEMVEEERF